MNLPYRSPFLFSLVQVGAEATLKSELMRLDKQWRPSYSRPGFVTFKRADESTVDPAHLLGSVFAREYGTSLGVVRAEAAEWAADFLVWLTAAQKEWGVPSVRLYVTSRPRFAPGEEPPGEDPAEAVEWGVKRALAQAGWNFGGRSELPDDGEWIVDLVLVERTEIWVGVHRQHAGHTGYPGGQIPCDMPDESPSRAYLKFVEAGRLWHIPFRSGDTVLEIGASPGGMSFAALERGLKVWGVDPGRMDPRVRATFSDRFHHVRTGILELRPEQVPQAPQWIVLDMNTPPDVSIQGLRHAWEVTRAAETALGLVMVLKMNQWKLAEEIPLYLERIRALGFVRVRARQLPSNRQEITLYAETPQGQLRHSTGQGSET